MKSPIGGQPRAMHATTMKLCARAAVCGLPLLGCLLGTEQLGEPDETSGATVASATSPADEGMTGPSAGDDGSTSGSGDETSATSASATEGGSTESDDDDASTGCSMRECTDVPLDDACDPWLQNCPAGQKCMPYITEGNAWNALMCSPIAEDPNGIGEPCTVEGSAGSGIDDCEWGAMCFYVDAETNVGTCVAQCGGTQMDPVCAEGTSCAIANEGVLTLCIQTCDPDLDECPAGQMCEPFDEDLFLCFPESVDPGGYGQDCTAFECNPGLVCLSAEYHANCVEGATGCCTPYCELDGRPCPDGMTCVLQNESDIGWCMLPE
jgi:hypothetical protein